ncbi:MAG: GNAT family N-acetyltransferase [Myxococcales bacterium]|nr:GNAT family N-acetyltransferase [Myxococcales bacterium]
MDVRRALEEVMFRAAWREPGCVVVDTPSLAQVITPAIPFAHANAVYRFVDADLERALAAFEDRPFRFLVTPSARPTDLAQRLVARGLELTSELAAMWAPTATPIAVPTDVVVEPLRAETLEEYCATSIAGWSMSEAQGANLRRSVEVYSRLDAYQGFLARVGGVSVGAGLVRIYADGVGYLQGSAVHPAWRGRGVYRALVAHRMQVIREAGAAVALIHARTTSSAPICARLGFRTEFRSASYDRT